MLSLDAALLLNVAFLIGIGGLLYRLRQRARTTAALEADHNATRRELAHAQQTLSQLQAQIGWVADVTLDGLLVVNRDRMIVLANKMAGQIFDPSEPLTGRTLMSVTRNHELDSMLDAIFSADDDLESQITSNERSFRVRGMRLAWDGQPAVALALQDVTELLRLTRARRDMVTNIAHDLGTPISSIQILLETLNRDFGKNPDKDRQKLGKIAGQIDNLQHMLEELKDLSAIESGKAIMRLVEVNLHDTAAKAIEMMTAQADQKKLEVVNHIPAGMVVLADPEKILRVINNLIHNAIKFTPDKGSIGLSAERQDSDEGLLAKVMVRDTGMGIPPAERSRIFERFYQVDSARSGQKSAVGAGLGLSIAKHIVTAHGGTIWAEPNLPTGACICFTLPLVTDTELALHSEAGQSR